MILRGYSQCSQSNTVYHTFPDIARQRVPFFPQVSFFQPPYFILNLYGQIEQITESLEILYISMTIQKPMIHFTEANKLEN